MIHVTPQPFTAQELLAKQLPPIHWVVPGLIPEGFVVLAGKSKTGKSWLALDVALAIAAGSRALGSFDVVRGAVLYLSLEDHERRLQKRISKLVSNEAPPDFFCEVEWPAADQGGLKMIDEFLTAHPEVRLVVIDTLAMLWPQKLGSGNAYIQDYTILKPFRQLAHKHKICLLVVHHLNKRRRSASDDPFDLVSGSTGIIGVADSIFQLERKRKEIYADLLVTGRDIEERELKLAWDGDTCRWSLIEKDETSQMSAERGEILGLLNEASRAMKPAEIAVALEKKRDNVKALLHSMKLQGQVIALGGGGYTTGKGITNITDSPGHRDDRNDPDDRDYRDDRPMDAADPVTAVIGNRPMPPDATRRDGHPKDQEG